MDEPELTVRTSIRASAPVVWAALADPRRITEWSPESSAVRSSREGPLPVGARFSGSNRNGPWRWSTQCVVIDSEPDRSFGFDVRFLGMAVARWRFLITSSPDGVVVEEQWWDHRGWVMRALGVVGTGVVDRRTHNEQGMRATLEALRSGLETGSAPA